MHFSTPFAPTDTPATSLSLLCIMQALLPAPQLRLLEVDILATVALQDLDACASMPCLRSLKLTAENKECNDPALTVQVAAAR